MGSRHTPGPWTVAERSPGRLGIDAKEPDGTYCQPALINGDALDEVYGPATRANAALVAAAPEMEKAVAHILVLIQQGVDDQDLEAIEGHCRAALAKAWEVSAEQVWTPDLADFGIQEPKGGGA